jgi:hypothetical protein
VVENKQQKMAIDLFLEGYSRHRIRKVMKVGAKKLNRWLKKTCEDKYNTAMHMFFNYNIENTIICLRLDLDIEILNRWIIGRCGSAKKTATYLYFNSIYSKKEICDEIGIPLIKLNSLIEEEFNKKKVVKFERPKIQEGFSDWVTGIIDRHKKVS